MDRDEYDRLVQQYLHRPGLSSASRETYSLSLRQYAKWFGDNEVDPETASITELIRYREWLQAQSYAEHTIHTRFKIVRTFYAYLHEVGHIDRDPAARIAFGDIARTTRTLLTVDELRSMWDACAGRDRVIFGLLALCSLSRDEVINARADDLHERAGRRVLSVPTRTSMNDLGYVAIPQQLVIEIDALLNGRRSGFIIKARGSSGTVAKTSINKVVARIVRHAGVPHKVTSRNLTLSARALAIENRFSFIAVARTTPTGSPLTTNELIRNIEVAPDEHVSIRVGRMVDATATMDDQMMLRAELILADRSQHPAVAVMVAGAALERVLREVALAASVAVNTETANIGTYASRLSGARVVTPAQNAIIISVGNARNDAAHGWFEKLNRSRAEQVLAQVGELLPALRAVEAEWIRIKS